MSSSPLVRVALGLLLWATVAVGGVACSHTGGAVRHVGGLVVDCQPADAEILLNDQYVGSVADLSGRALDVPPGLVRLELRREGYFSSYHEIRAVEGLRQTLRVELRRRP